MPTYSISPANVQEVANDIRSGAGQITSKSRQWTRDLAVSAEWSGNDQDQYAAYKLKWDGLFEDMRVILTGKASKALDDMVTNVLSTEKNLTSGWTH